MSDKIRVLLVDDQDVFRHGLQSALESEKDIDVVGECTNAEEALYEAERLSPDIVLMEIEMAHGDGIRAMRRLKEKQPSANVIILTSYDGYVAQAIEAGAKGYLLKDCKCEELIAAIRVVREGKAAFSPLSQEFVSKLATLIRNTGPCFLSERELATLRLIAEGANNRQIGAQTFVSETTAKRDVERIFEKLGVKSRCEAVAEAYRRNLI